MRTMRKTWTPVLPLLVLAVACGGGSDSPDEGASSTTAPPGAEQAGEHGHAGQGGHGGPAGGGATCSPSGTSLSLVADNIRFDKECLAAPAGRPFTIAYENRQSLPHNLVILESHTATDVMFRADIFTGPRTVTLQVPALEAGTYAFHCEVHPSQMQGTFVVA